MPLPVVLRDVRESDIDSFYEHQADPEAAAMAAFASRDRTAVRAKWREIMANPVLWARTIVVGDAIAGHIVSWPEGGHQELGYWVDRRFWGQGVATSAVEQFKDLVTQRPIEAWVAPHNVGSRRVLEKAGFRYDRDESDYVVYVIGKGGGGMLRGAPMFSGFSVNDLEEARRFYGEKLGLEVHDGPMGVLEIKAPHGDGHVMAYFKPNHEPATYTMLNFIVPDIERAVDDLTAIGVDFESYDMPELRTDQKGIARGEYGPPMAWFKDPAGNIIGVLEQTQG